MRTLPPRLLVDNSFTPPAASSARGKARSRWLLAAKLILGTLLFGIVLWQVNIGHVSQVLLAADVPKIVGAIGFLFAAVVVNAHRWYMISAMIQRPLPFRVAMIGYFESMFFNQVLPTSIGGDASRVFRAIDAGLAYGWAVTGVLIDRAFGLWVVAFSIILARLLGSSPIASTSAFLVIDIASIVILCGSIVAAIIGKLVKADTVPVWAAAFLVLSKSFYACVSTPATILIAIDLVLTTILTVGSFALCASAVHIALGFWDATIIMQGVVLASILPASVGGWGLREGASIVLFAPLGIASGDAAAVSILFGLAITALGLMGAIVWIGTGYRRRIRTSTGQSETL